MCHCLYHCLTSYYQRKHPLLGIMQLLDTALLDDELLFNNKLLIDGIPLFVVLLAVVLQHQYDV